MARAEVSVANRRSFARGQNSVSPEGAAWRAARIQCRQEGAAWRAPRIQRRQGALHGARPEFSVAKGRCMARVAKAGFPANDPILSSARRNKFEMSERARSFGSEHAAVIQRFELTFASLLLKISVRAVQQKRATELEAVLVVKPVASSGTDNVFCCESIRW